MGEQGKRQLVFTGQSPPLPRQNRLISKGPPTALPLDPTQQGWMGFKGVPIGAFTFEAKAHDTLSAGETGRTAMARALRQ